MNAWGLSPDSVPPEALPSCGHGHEVGLMRRGPNGYVVVCDACGAVGATVAPDELERRGWRLADIEELDR